jgi:hypothetical protein
MADIGFISKIDDTIRPKRGKVEDMRTHILSKIHSTLAGQDTDSSEEIARELVKQGLTGVADEDTWRLNSRIDYHEFETHDRARRARGRFNHYTSAR